MKKINHSIVVYLIINFIAVSNIYSKEPSALKRYQIKSGIIEYKLTGNKSGSETVYFDNWGSTEAKYVNVINKLAGQTQTEKRLDLIQGEWAYSVNLENKTGIKVNNQMKEIAKQYKTDDLAKVGEQMLISIGGKKTGTENILGKQCTVWEMKQIGTKVWVWKGITLKTHSKISGMEFTSIATKLQENTSIPADKLKLPQGVKINEMPTNK